MYCNFCQMHHSSSSCYHPGNPRNSSASGSNDLLATDNSTVGAFDGYAGESHEWGHEFVRVIVKVKKSEALKMKECALIGMQW